MDYSQTRFTAGSHGMRNLGINGERLWQSLMEMAKIGATEKGGVCRLALSDLDKAGRELFIRWCEQAGCTVSIDRMGNIFARPTGVRFDGVYGVLAGLEVIRTLNDLDYETEAPIEVVCWTNEEGSRFSPPMGGSGGFAA